MLITYNLKRLHVATNLNFFASEEILVVFRRFFHAEFSGVVRNLASRNILEKNGMKFSNISAH